jgi:hypothetical protein
VTAAEDPSTTPWRPTNEAEQGLLAAIERNDRQEFFRILATATLYVAQQVPDPTKVLATDPANFVTYAADDQTYLLVFTSVEALAAAVGQIANGYVESDYEELRAALPDEGIRLGFNMGTPVDAWVEVDTVARAAAGDIIVPTGAEMADLLELQDPANEAAVEAAVEQGITEHVEDYLDQILAGDVLVPVSRPARAPTGPLPRDFPWLITQVGHERTVEVFSEDKYVPPGTTTVKVPFTALVEAWPHRDVQLAVNPGTPLGFMLPAEAIEPFARSAAPPATRPDPATRPGPTPSA